MAMKAAYGTEATNAPKLDTPIPVTIGFWRGGELEIFHFLVAYRANVKAYFKKNIGDEMTAIATFASTFRSLMATDDEASSDHDSPVFYDHDDDGEPGDKLTLSSAEVWDRVMSDDGLYIKAEILNQVYKDLVSEMAGRPTTA